MAKFKVESLLKSIIFVLLSFSLVSIYTTTVLKQSRVMAKFKVESLLKSIMFVLSGFSLVQLKQKHKIPHIYIFDSNLTSTGWTILSLSLSLSQTSPPLPVLLN